jgi:aquaporin Z
MKIPWGPLLSELVGTAFLIAVGVSVVIIDFGLGGPVAPLLPNAGIRRLITGFLFGTTGALITLSPVGKESGAHINPVVTLAFWLRGKLRGRHAIGYVLAQLIGCILGAVPLLVWGQMGISIEFGATLPGSDYGAGAAVLGEVAATFLLITGIFLFIGHKRLRPFTPLLFPFLYAVMVYLEAPISGTSTNPARSLGPAIISGDWRDWWVYWVGPLLGTLLAVGMFKHPWLARFEVEVAKLYHFDLDRNGIFKRQSDEP